MAKKKTSRKKKTSKKSGKKTSGRKKPASVKKANSKTKLAKDRLKIFGQPKISIATSSKISSTFNRLQSSRQRLKDSSAKERIRKLKHLKEAISVHQDALCEAIYLDFHKPPAETELTEIIPVKAELTDAIENLKYWMAPRQVDTPVTLLTSNAYICREPLGTALILGPWNYPFHLCIAPLIPAIAAGNSVLIKPSELTPHTSRFIKQFIEDIFPDDEVAVLEGDHTTASELTCLPFDHIFFTGSTAVGKLVMQSASKNLASVTLELGGKSPVIVDETADLKKAAQRIMWGKCVNAGQTCVAPDYLFLPSEKRDEFIQECKTVIQKFYGSDPETIQNSPDLCRIINDRNFNRLNHLLLDAQKKGAKIRIGGTVDKDDRFIEPTILTGVSRNSDIMKEEIFGPILPVLTYKHIDEVFEYIAGRDKPLSLYIFSSKNKNINNILARTTSGGTTINDVLLHLANGNLPFGGVNHSGIGKYHGEYGFAALSNERAVLRQGWFATIQMMYPPYSKKVKRLIKWVRKFFV